MIPSLKQNNIFENEQNDEYFSRKDQQKTIETSWSRKVTKVFL